MPQSSMEAVLREKFTALAPVLDERTRRLWAATEAQALGRGGLTLVAKVTGLSRRTIARGVRELTQCDDSKPLPRLRVRHPGAGRKPIIHHQPSLLAALEALVEPTSRGD